MVPLTSPPTGFQEQYFNYKYSTEIPQVRRIENTLTIPIFVQPSLVVEHAETGEEQINGYKYYTVDVTYRGQDLTSYIMLLFQSYAEIRAFFYGSASVQNEQQYKSEFTAHQTAVRLAFPKHWGELITASLRWEDLKIKFWTLIDNILIELNMTRADLPHNFDGETMFAIAYEKGMTPARISELTTQFFALSVDLLHNGRAWGELFVEPLPPSLVD